MLPAVGFFFLLASCGNHQQLLEKSKEQFQSGQPETALAEVNRILADDPGHTGARILKAEILADMAFSTDPPALRLQHYREMRAVLEPDNGEDQNFLEKRKEVIYTSWSREQGAAVRSLPREGNDPGSLMYSMAMDHFENALAINPDSSTTWKLKSTAHYRHGDVSLAVQTLEKATETLQPVPADFRERLAFLYLEEGQLDRSIRAYETLYDQDPENVSWAMGLANAYILAAQHFNSVPLLRQLSEEHPENINTYEALTTELYFLIQTEINGIIDAATAGTGDVLSEEWPGLEELLLEAEDHLRVVQERHPDPDEFTYLAASFYKNSAAALLRLASHTSQEPSPQIRERAHVLLHRSVPLWEAIADRNPENPEIWRSIYQVYRQLDLNAEADAIEHRINL